MRHRRRSTLKALGEQIGIRKGRPLSVYTAAPSAVELVNAVIEQLRQYLTERRRDSAYIGPEYAELTAALEEFVLRGGKRVRPLFAYWGWRAVAGQDRHVRRARRCGCSPRWNCCTPVPWPTTT